MNVSSKLNHSGAGEMPLTGLIDRMSFPKRIRFFSLDIVLYCIEGVVIAAQFTATFSISIVLPRI